MLLVCLNAGSATQQAVHETGAFGVNILAEHQGHLAERFAGRAGDRFRDVAVRAGHTGVPVLAEALAVLECRVAETVQGGTHRVFLADVVHAEAREGSPLAYFRGRFGRFELAQDAEVYRELRELVLSREAGPDQPLDVDRLAARLRAPHSSVHYALTRLVADGLVLRDADRGHVVAPLDVRTSDDVHDAKLAMELGALELTVGRLDPARLAELRRLAEETVPLVEDGRFTDVTAYVEANTRFHAALIEATGVAALVDAYRRLSVHDLMTRALAAGPRLAADHLATDHLELVAAYERADTEAAKRIVVAHNDRAKATQRAGIERAGGRL
jgi:DNA-binding GntR family transcriptional regulator